jgi:hypothetical protein
MHVKRALASMKAEIRELDGQVGLFARLVEEERRSRKEEGAQQGDGDAHKGLDLP